jgi:hypothetical protein
MTRQAVRRDVVLSAAIPLVVMGSFYLFVGSVAASMGRLPNIDLLPRPLEIWEAVAVLPMLLLCPASFLALALSLVSRLGNLRRFTAPITAFAITAGIAVIVTIIIDPGGWFTWVMD